MKSPTENSRILAARPGRHILCACLILLLAACAAPPADPFIITDTSGASSNTPTDTPAATPPNEASAAEATSETSLPFVKSPGDAPTEGAPTVDVPTGDALSNADFKIDYAQVVSPAPPYYGTNGWWNDADADLYTRRYTELGGNIVRITAIQGLFEPENDNADPNVIAADGFFFDKPVSIGDRSITLGLWLNALNRLDYTVMLNVPTLAYWLSKNDSPPGTLTASYPPNDMAEYAEYITALLRFAIEQGGIPPERLILEPINEPDLGCGQDAAVSCFWENWTPEDVLETLDAAEGAARSVDQAIRVVGVAECCGTQFIDELLLNRGWQDRFDGLTYHKYVSSGNFDDGIQRGLHLIKYGKPVFINEYGNTHYWSNGLEGALWHAYTLPQIWSAGISPVQFSMSHFPGMHAGYNELGLFMDRNENYEIKPSYWVYVNFYNNFGGGEVVWSGTQRPVMLLASRKMLDGAPALAIWLVNKGQSGAANQSFAIAGLPEGMDSVRVIDSLRAPGPANLQEPTTSYADGVLRFELSVPDQSVLLLVVE